MLHYYNIKTIPKKFVTLAKIQFLPIKTDPSVINRVVNRLKLKINSHVNFYNILFVTQSCQSPIPS